MSLPADVQGKKRKKSLATAVDSDEPHSKKSRKNGKEKKYMKKDKTKAKVKAKEVGGEFRVARASLVVSIPPVFAGNPRGGVEEMLDSIVMRYVFGPHKMSWIVCMVDLEVVYVYRYVPSLQGVVLAHSNLQFLDQKASIKADCPYAICNVGFDATVWSPHAGMKLVGRVNLCSPDHISLLVHRTFNVSIPRHHIPIDQWEFEYGPAENDPEFGPHAVPEGEDDPMNADESQNQNDDETHEIEGGGRWVHKITGDRLGGAKQQLEFTVIRLTIANNMLSLIGSIQPDPFSPEHIPVNVASTQAEPEEDAPALDEEDEEYPEEDSDEDEDPFTKLGKMGDEAKRRAEKVEKAKKEEAKKEKKEKRKRKAENAGVQSESKRAKKKKKA
ncbi:hypothetical protein NEOLEDRAFT_1139478 [Neolentinus lepideus HHB14362 ss-1]|uniref:RPA43 OB domain-containing protein n=1 Tax=Neolentinus lepideus HHB14362 ss-1 TaxID=1314782 RepID=A0A165PQW9_9AGAM|nr:hypothetical protein NEOLEDRAFT_1139478 [Neolentinus lepideus HHB14362 ss-1]